MGVMLKSKTKEEKGKFFVCFFPVFVGVVVGVLFVHDRDIRLARTKTSAVSEHAHNTGHKPLWNEVKFIDRDPYYYTRRVKEAIHIRLYPDNINTIKKTQQQESRATADRRGSKSLSEQQGSKCTNQSC